MNTELKRETADKRPTVEQKFSKVQQFLSRYGKVGVQKEEANVYRNVVLELEKTASMTANGINSKLNQLTGSPYFLHQRTAGLQLIIYGWLIKKLKVSGSSDLKEKLLQRYSSLINLLNTQDRGLKQVLSAYKLADRALNPGVFVPGDPLMDTPAEVPLDKSFYSGKNPNDILPLGVNGKLFIPENFQELLNKADAFQIVLLKILGANLYSPFVKWYNKQNRVVMNLLTPVPKLFQKLIVDFIETFSAKKIASMIRGVKTVSEKCNKITTVHKHMMTMFYNNICGTLGNNAGILSGIIMPQIEKSQKSSNSYFKSLLTIGASVFDIAARNPHAMKKERAGKMPKPDCYIQNKLFVMACIQHKNAKGMQKYLVEFIAMTISNFKDDNELRRNIKALEPAVRYLVLYTPLGRELTKNMPYQKTWAKMTSAEKEDMFRTFYDMLTGAVLSPKEKNCPRYKVLSAMNDIFVSSIAKLVEKNPDDNEKANLMLTTSMLIKNITTHLISATGDKQKADRMIDKLTGIIRLLKNRLSENDRKKIARENPTLLVFIDNPDIISAYLKGTVVAAPKVSAHVRSFISNWANKIETISKQPVTDIEIVKKIILQYQNAYKLLENKKNQIEAKIKQNILKGQLLEQAKNQLISIKTELSNYQGRIRIQAMRLKKLHERGAVLKNLTQLLKNSSNPAVIASLITVITTIETENLPENLKKRINSGVLSELLKVKDMKNYLYISNHYVDQLINYTGKLFSSVPGSGTAFKSMFLNTVKTNNKFELYRKNPAQFLSDMNNRNILKQSILSSMLDSIRHSRNYRYFEKRGPSSAYQIVSNAIDKLLSFRVA